MKKLMLSVMMFVMALGLVSCGRGEDHTIEIVIPAGTWDTIVYADEEISPKKDTLKISAGAGITSSDVVLLPVEVTEENAYEPMYLQQNEPVKMDVEKNAWFKIGVAIQNPSNHDIAVAIEVEDVELRIAASIQDETDDNERPGATRFIIGIWDKTEQDQIVCAEVEEKFYEDETTEYYFNVVKSQHIFVSYNNANSEDIVTALKSGRATIEDLDFYGIEYHTKPKK